MRCYARGAPNICHPAKIVWIANIKLIRDLSALTRETLKIVVGVTIQTAVDEREVKAPHESGLLETLSALPFELRALHRRQ